MKRFGLVVAALCWTMLAVPSSALVITVGGQQYDIQFIDNSFDAANTGSPGLLESQPWWGSGNQADAFRDAYSAAATGLATGWYNFAFNFNANNTTRVRYSTHLVTDASGTFEDRVGVTRTNQNRTFGANLGGDDVTYNLLWATATEVPEIDGPVLAQVAFVLGGLLLGTRAHRRRRTGA